MSDWKRLRQRKGISNLKHIPPFSGPSLCVDTLTGSEVSDSVSSIVTARQLEASESFSRTLELLDSENGHRLHKRRKLAAMLATYVGE